MGILDEMQEQEPATTELESLRSEVDRIKLYMLEMTKAVNGQTALLEQLIDRPVPQSTSQPSEPDSRRIASVETRLSEIEKTLGVLAENVDGRTMKSVGQKLLSATKVTATATETLTAEVAALRTTVTALSESVPAVQAVAEKSIREASAAAATAATTTATARVASVGQRIEKLEAVTAAIEGQQLWTKVSAFALSLLPASSLLVGVTLLIGGFGMGLGAASDFADAGGFMNGVRALFTFAALIATAVGLYKLLMWIAGLIEQWKQRPPGS